MTTQWLTSSPVGLIDPPDISFEDVEDAIAARRRPVQLFVRIGGVAINAHEAHVQHSVDRPIGGCTIHCAAPRPSTVTMNAEVEIEMGYTGAVRRVFHGFIPSDESVTDDRGGSVRIEGVGWCSRLAYPEFAGVEIAGPVSLKDAFRSLCELRDIPTYLADDTTYVDGSTTIELGGNDYVNGGHVRFDNKTDPLTWMTRNAELYGYRVFDSPDGAVRLARISGVPTPAFDTAIQTMDIQPGDVIAKNSHFPFPWYLWTNPTGAFDLANMIAELSEGNWGVVGDEPFTTNSGYTMVPVTLSGIGYGWVAAYFTSPDTFYFDVVTFTIPTYEEGVNVYRLSKRRSSDPMATYIEVLGARYTDVAGGTLHIRSIADEVPYAAELDPPGYRQATISSQDIVTDEQAAGVRNVAEVDRSEVWEYVNWECAGRPDLQPGDVVQITGDSHDIPAETFWLMSIDQSVSDRGYVARMEGWYGAGQPLAAGNDCVTQTVTIAGDGVVHVGDETVSWYKDTTPDGTEVTITIDIDHDDYSSLRLTGRVHGSNSYGSIVPTLGDWNNDWLGHLPVASRSTARTLGETFARALLAQGTSATTTLKNTAITQFNAAYPGNQTTFTKYINFIISDTKANPSKAATGSVIEVWQLDDPSLPESGSNEKQRKGSMELPTANEEYNKRRNYSSSNTYWQSFSLPMPGQLKIGAAELRLIAGENPTGGVDDYEIKDLALVTCGVGIPDLPGTAS
jgi:hypothetical protein